MVFFPDCKGCDVNFSTYQTVLLVLILALTHVVIIFILLMFIYQKGIAFIFSESTNSHPNDIVTSEGIWSKPVFDSVSQF